MAMCRVGGNTIHYYCMILPRLHRRTIKWLSRPLAAVDIVAPPVFQRAMRLLGTVKLNPRFLKILDPGGHLLCLGALWPLFGAIVVLLVILAVSIFAQGSAATAQNATDTQQSVTGYKNSGPDFAGALCATLA